MKKYLILIFMFMFIINVQGMGTKKIASIESDKNTFLYNIVSTSDEGFVIVGSANSTKTQNDKYTKGIITKYDSNYKKEWITSYGNEENYTFNNVVEHNNKYIVVGSFFSLKGIYGVLIAFDSNGNFLWEKQTKDIYLDNIVEMDNYYYVIGSIISSNIDHGVIIKFDDEGNIIWKRNHYSGDEALLKCITTSIDEESIIIAGTSYYEDIEDPYYKVRRIIASYDKQGNMIWEKEDKPNIYGNYNYILPIEDGYLLAGYKYDNYIQNASLTKTDNRGNIIWEKDYSSNKEIVANSYFNVFPYKNNYIVIGDSNRDTSNDNIFNTIRSPFMNQYKSSLTYSIFDKEGNNSEFKILNIGDIMNSTLMNNNDLLLIQNISKGDNVKSSYIYLINDSIINTPNITKIISFIVIIGVGYIMYTFKKKSKKNVSNL